MFGYLSNTIETIAKTVGMSSQETKNDDINNINDDIKLNNNDNDITINDINILSDKISDIKSKGNNYFKKKEYHHAIDLYDDAIDLYTKNIKNIKDNNNINENDNNSEIITIDKLKNIVGAIYNNRAFCYFRLEMYGAAVDDSTQAIKLKFYKVY